MPQPQPLHVCVRNTIDDNSYLEEPYMPCHETDKRCKLFNVLQWTTRRSRVQHRTAWSEEDSTAVELKGATALDCMSYKLPSTPRIDSSGNNCVHSWIIMSGCRAGCCKAQSQQINGMADACANSSRLPRVEKATQVVPAISTESFEESPEVVGQS